MQTLNELLSHYSQVQLAQAEDNERILDFVANIAMQTRDGGLGIERGPNFFALANMQGEKSFVFLFLNTDDSLGGVGCVSLTKMQIKGQTQYLGYTSDLKLSRQIDKETRKQFYHFYESLIENFKQIHEFEGCEYIIASILKDNTAANRALVQKTSKKNRLEHLPLYTYENVNVMARLPLPQPQQHLGRFVDGSQVSQEQLLDFLTANTQSNDLVWSKQEVRRRLQQSQSSFRDFLVLLDDQSEIIACCLLLTDRQYRKMKITNMPKSLKISQIFTGLIGSPKIKENQPLRIGYISFLKMKPQQPKQRCHIIDLFLRYIFKQQLKVAKNERYHLINLQEPADHRMGQRLMKKGYICKGLQSTLHQVIHGQNLKAENLMSLQGQRPDFDVVFH